MKFLHFLKAEIYPNQKFSTPKMAKIAVLDLLDSPKLISRKIWETEKFWDFHTVTTFVYIHEAGDGDKIVYN